MRLTITSLINGVPRSMGSYAPILDEVEQIIEDPNSNLLDIGEVLGRDPELTARLLKLGNSSFYGFPSRLETVADAVNLIGIQQVRDLLIATNVLVTFTGVSPELVNMQSFWRHSLACGIGARFLAIERRIPKPDKLFVAGLLHDVGRLVLYSQAPAQAREVFRRHQTRRMLLREAESEVLGFDHAEIGEALLSQWQYPANLVEAVGCHHRPQTARLFPTETAVVHLSDHLVNAMQLGTSGENLVPPLNEEAWDKLKLNPSVLESAMRAIDDQLESVETVFLEAARQRAA